MMVGPEDDWTTQLTEEQRKEGIMEIQEPAEEHVEGNESSRNLGADRKS